MTRLKELFSTENQSPWLDNLRRSWILNGELQNWIDNGVRGITSNPTIFQKVQMNSRRLVKCTTMGDYRAVICDVYNWNNRINKIKLDD